MGSRMNHPAASPKPPAINPAPSRPRRAVSANHQKISAVLCRQIQTAKTPAEKSAAQTELLRANDGLVSTVALRIANEPGVELDDAIQECRIRLLAAAETYRPRKAKFSTYATNGMGLFARRECTRKTRRRAGQMGGDGQWAAEDIPEQSAPDPFDREAFAIALGRLNSDELEIVTAKFGLDGGPPVSLRAIAERRGYSWQWASMIMSRAKSIIRDTLAGIDDPENPGAAMVVSRRAAAKYHPRRGRPVMRL